MTQPKLDSLDKHASTPGAPADDDVAAILAQYDQMLQGDILSLLEAAMEAEENDEDDSLVRDRAFLAHLETIWPRAGTSAGPHRPRVENSAVIQPADTPVETDRSHTAIAGVAATSEDGTRSNFGRFEIRRVVGRGGSGIVFLAYDSILHRLVALKLPRPELLLTASARRRFLREGHAAAALNHPNILPLYEAGELGPIAYLVSAYCHGPSLASWLAEQTEPVDVRIAVEWLVRLCDAVEYAHSQGVLHRDIKPGNIMLDPAAAGSIGYDAVRLCDFGLAKLCDGPELETRSGTLLGTPLYMSPEQAQGQLEQIGPATDVHALGAVLYEILTRQAAFAGASEVEILRKVAHDEPASPWQLRADVPRDLGAIILKCLEKRPSQRYASAADLGADLRRFLGGEVTSARPVSSLARAYRWSRRYPVPAVLLATLLLAISLGFAGVTWQWRRAENHLAQAKIARARAEDHMRRENILISDMYHSANRENPELIKFGIGKNVANELRAHYQEIVERQAEDGYSAAQVATAYGKWALLMQAEGEHAQALTLLNQSFALWNDLARQQPDSRSLQLGMADTFIDASCMQLDLQRRDLAREYLERAAQQIEREEFVDIRDDVDRRRLGQVYLRVAQAEYNAGEFAAALSVYESAIEYWNRYLRFTTDFDSCSPRLTAGLRGKAKSLYQLHRFDEAVEVGQEATSKYEQHLVRQPGNPSFLNGLATILMTVAKSHAELGNEAASLIAYQRALDLVTELQARGLAVETTNYDQSRALKALVTASDKRHGSAGTVGLRRQLVAALEASLADDSQNRKARFQLGTTLFELAHHEAGINNQQARVTFERARDQFERLTRDGKSESRDWRQLAYCNFQIARLWTAKGHADEAALAYSTAAEIYRKLRVESPQEHTFINDLAECERVLAHWAAVTPQ